MQHNQGEGEHDPSCGVHGRRIGAVRQCCRLHVCDRDIGQRETTDAVPLGGVEAQAIDSAPSSNPLTRSP